MPAIVEYRTGALFSDVLETLDPAERDQLLEGRATTLVLDAGRMIEHYGVESVERAVELLLDDLDPVFVWWAQRTERDPLTIWWSQRPHKVEAFTGLEPLWLAFCASGGRFADRALRVVQRTRAFMTAEMSVKPLADGMTLKAAMLGNVLHVFAAESAQGIITPEVTAEHFAVRVSTVPAALPAPGATVTLPVVVARVLAAFADDADPRVLVDGERTLWEIGSGRRFLRCVVSGAADATGGVTSADLRRLAAIPPALCRAGVDDELTLREAPAWLAPTAEGEGASRLGVVEVGILAAVTHALPSNEGWVVSSFGAGLRFTTSCFSGPLESVELVFVD